MSVSIVDKLGQLNGWLVFNDVMTVSVIAGAAENGVASLNTTTLVVGAAIEVTFDVAQVTLLQAVKTARIVLKRNYKFELKLK